MSLTRILLNSTFQPAFLSSMNSTTHSRPSNTITSVTPRPPHAPRRLSPIRRAGADALRFLTNRQQVRFAALMALSLCGFAGQATAQTVPRDTVVDERLWSTLVLQRRQDAPGPWRWGLESFVRTRDGVSAIDSAAVRPIVNYVLDKHSTIGGGYAYAVSSPTTLDLREHRLFQQYIFTTPAIHGTITVRERFEERFIERNSGMAARLRSQFRYSRPMRPGSRFSLVGYDELFVYLNTTTATRQGVEHN